MGKAHFKKLHQTDDVWDLEAGAVVTVKIKYSLAMLRNTVVGVSGTAKSGGKPCQDSPTMYPPRAQPLAKMFCVCSGAGHSSSLISFDFQNLSNKFREAGASAPSKRQCEVKRACERSTPSPERRLSVGLRSAEAGGAGVTR